MHNFSFGGKNLLQFGGRILQAPSHTIAKRNTQRVKVYGKSGDVIVDNESYDNVDFSLEICFMPYLTERTAHDLAYAVIDWLAPLQNGYYEYRDTYNPGYFTQAALINFGEVVRELPTLLTATLKFSRVPFWYSNNGVLEIKDIEDGDTITNIEQYSAEPIVFLEFTKDDSRTYTTNFGVNGEKVMLKMGTGNLIHILDGVQKQHYRIEDGSKVYLSAALPPMLPPGDITFSITPQASQKYVKCSVIPNWRRL